MRRQWGVSTFKTNTGEWRTRWERGSNREDEAKAIALLRRLIDSIEAERAGEEAEDARRERGIEVVE